MLVREAVEIGVCFVVCFVVERRDWFRVLFVEPWEIRKGVEDSWKVLIWEERCVMRRVWASILRVRWWGGGGIGLVL